VALLLREANGDERRVGVALLLREANGDERQAATRELARVSSNGDRGGPGKAGPNGYMP
jgi:hypothetical protein